MNGNWLRHPLATWRLARQERSRACLAALKGRYHTFRSLLDDNNRAVALLTEIGIRLRANAIPSEELLALIAVTAKLVDKLDHLGQEGPAALTLLHRQLAARINQLLHDDQPPPLPTPAILALDELTPAHRRIAGGKATALAKLRHSGRYRVPDGFVIPVPACRLFLDHHELFFRIISHLSPYLPGEGEEELPSPLLDEIQEMILAAPLPESLAAAIVEHGRRFFADPASRGLAVRSSAAGEDSRSHSFAGQYRSRLNLTTPEGLIQAFKEVVASSFSGRNLAYRRHAGLDPLTFDLAVLCLGMVPARSAGVLFTVDPNRPDSQRMLVSGVHGLGELAVAGGSMADLYYPARDGGAGLPPVIARKEQRLVCSGEGGIVLEEVREEERERPALSPSELQTLVGWGLEIEKAEGCPQDIEWAVDHQGQPVLLQARPFQLARGYSAPRPRVEAGRPPLLEGGILACGGSGVGQVWRVRGRRDLDRPPPSPYILAMHQSLADAVPALRHARGVLIDLGNPADHLSCVAREYNIPMLTGLGRASELLAPGSWVLMEAESGRVWSARAEEIAHAEEDREQRAASPPLPELPEEPVAAELHKLIVPLHLTGAYGATFSVRECQTLHDLIRYIHEKAVLAMFDSGDQALEESGGEVFALDSPVPFAVSIIDLGGGLLPRLRRQRRIAPEEVISVPFAALWRGIATPGLNWGAEEGGVAIGSVVSNWLTDHKSARPVGMPNYVILTRDYCNVNARMDFHFTMIDTVCGIDRRSNYIKFRFKGGGTTGVQRRRRIQCIAEILESSGFFTDVRDDLISATLQGAPQALMEEKLALLGRLLGFTRLLDAAMRDDQAPGRAARTFLARKEYLPAISPKGETS